MNKEGKNNWDEKRSLMEYEKIYFSSEELKWEIEFSFGHKIPKYLHETQFKNSCLDEIDTWNLSKEDEYEYHKLIEYYIDFVFDKETGRKFPFFKHTQSDEGKNDYPSDEKIEGMLASI